MGKRYFSYLRVSTNRQSVSGLGLEAQREQVCRFVNASGGELIAEAVEVESGKVHDRPVLVKLISQCRQERATLIIAKLDRLARSVAFISSLMEAGVDFVAVDMPFANKLMLHLMAAFAEHERTEIGLRTRAALAAAKARGVKLGANGQALAATRKSDASLFAETLRAPVQELLDAGSETFREMAKGLNLMGLRTREGMCWTPGTAHRLMKRLEVGSLSCQTAMPVAGGM